MSLPIHLQNIKSSGIYRFTFDKSEIANVDTSILRLVVGYSPKGVFNTVVYVKTESQFKEIFGDISKKLEKRGVFFHRLALQSLERGPILCLNLKKFSTESVQAKTFDVDTLTSSATIDIPVEKLFDTTRLWKLSPDSLRSSVSDNPGYITASSIDDNKTSTTLFLRKSTARGYELSIADWYTTYSFDKEVPEWADGHKDELVSDFLVDAYIFRGEFTPALVKSDTFKPYFDVVDGVVSLKPYLLNAFGEKIDTLDTLAAVEGSGYVASYTGSLLPEFRGADGSFATLDNVLNSESEKHNLMFKIDTDGVDDGTVGLEDITLNRVLQIDGAIDTVLADGSLASPVLSLPVLSPEIVTFRLSTDLTSWEATNTAFLNGPDVAAYVLGADSSLDLAGTTITTTDSLEASIFDEGALYHGVTGIVKCLNHTSATVGDVTTHTIVLDGVIEAVVKEEESLIVKYITACSTSGSLVPTFLKGYTMVKPLPTSLSELHKLEWQKEILSSLTEYRGLRDALVNGKDVDYRYIIDTFESFIDSGIKSELTGIAKKKENAVAICNAPFIDTFKNCKSVSFTDSKGRFDFAYIGEGGNRLKPYGALFSLPTSTNGASWGIFYSAAKISDGSGKYNIPSAAIVGNLFIDKYSSRQPYYIVAGPNYGRVQATGLVGPDFNFSRADLDVLEPMGINALVYDPRKGTYINSNQTAQQSPVTSLSKANVRELVIFLQDTIDAMLTGYHWEMNTQTLRDIVKGQADTICERVKSNNGLYVYQNICDETNNTDEVLSNEMIILDTAIEAAMGAGKMVQRLTIYKKGGITATIL